MRRKARGGLTDDLQPRAGTAIAESVHGVNKYVNKKVSRAMSVCSEVHKKKTRACRINITTIIVICTAHWYEQSQPRAHATRVGSRLASFANRCDDLLMKSSNLWDFQHAIHHHTASLIDATDCPSNSSHAHTKRPHRAFLRIDSAHYSTDYNLANLLSSTRPRATNS